MMGKNPLTGIICLWSGAIVDIPDGWLLCDGANGTPDLTDKFIIGAGDTYAPGAAGGGVNHTHDFTGDGHQHTLQVYTDVFNGFPDGSWSPITDTQSATGTTDADGILPPYYALAYIIKV